jgi:hypothetical protein
MDLSDVEMFSGTHDPELTKKFLTGADRHFCMDMDDYKPFRFIGSTHDPKRYTKTVKEIWGKKRQFPTREKVQMMRQSFEIRGLFDVDGDLRVDCVCGQAHLKNFSIIMNTELEWKEAYLRKQVIGNDCIKKFYHEDAFKPICTDCREVVKLVPKQDKCPECYYPKCRSCKGIMKKPMGPGKLFCKTACKEGYCKKCGYKVKRNLRAKKVLTYPAGVLEFPFYEWCYPCNPKYSEWEKKK